MVKMNKSYGVATQLDIDVFEKKHHCSLPSEYKTFLLHTNGGLPDLPEIHIFGYGESIVNVFYGINISGIYNLDSVMERIEDLFSFSHVLPIASDPGGNIFFIGIAEYNYGKIFFWDSEVWDDDEAMQHLINVSPSFDEFVALKS